MPIKQPSIATNSPITRLRGDPLIARKGDIFPQLFMQLINACETSCAKAGKPASRCLKGWELAS